ncbi:hypothetical protein [Thermostaphylospora chromogena]|uniref:Integral membrane protein n=1 Tax=Thermostaphylospora chromogena TaxID=35622 RepID=A0A1H1GJ87_9ACTN|nr:hypothetical protein [Thermostaphylospora chromogena]SDR13241.1 hypothetical protein SAMN04489764_3628 [Thermostaphylospora chromogena]
MEAIRLVLLFLHLLGFAVLLGAFIAQLRLKLPKVSSGMLHGAIAQLVTGVALVGVREAADMTVVHAKIGAKLGIDVILLVIAIVGMRRTTSPWPFYTVGALTVVEAAVAVFWT